MTPFQFAREERANLQSDGCCPGVTFEAKLSVRRAELPVALSAGWGEKRCRYFETRHPPLADMVSDLRRAIAT